MKEKRKQENVDENFFESLWFRFFPYWPLFVFLGATFLVLAYVYAASKKPVYTVNATIAINNVGNAAPSYSNQPFQALNAYAERQVVDNEVLILQSRSLMKEVVNNLRLYASFYQKERVGQRQVYLSCPVDIEAKDPEQLKLAQNIQFTYHRAKNAVSIGGKEYPLNQWINLPYGVIRFVNSRRDTTGNGKEFYFSINHPTIVANYLLGGLKVNSVNKLATLINISYQSEVPAQAADIINELIRVYMHSSVEHGSEMAASTLAFVDERLGEVERDLDSIERQIQQFRATQGVIDLSEQGRLFLQNAAENDRRITEINTQLAVLDQVERYVNAQGGQTGIVPTTLGIDDPVLVQLLQRLNDLELQRANLRTTAGESNPMVTSVESEIAKIRPNIRSIVNNQRSRLTAGRNNLTATTNRFNSNIRNIPEQERRLLDISRQQAVKRDLYSFLLQRREEAALSNASNIAENRVVDWADPKSAVASSKKIIFLLGGLLAAFALGIAYIISKEVMSSNLLFRSSVEKLTTLPVIGEIVYRKAASKRYTGMGTPVVTEDFRRLATALGLFNGATGQKRVMVTSHLPNEGKTYVSSHLALALALSGKKVMLLDLNLHAPEIAERFELQSQIGAKEVLQGKAKWNEALQKTSLPLLHVLPAGQGGGDAMELLLPEKLHPLFQALEQAYDLVVIDSPPIELSTDAYAIGASCDATVVVVRHGVTPTNIIRKMDENPRLAHISNLNIVFNGIKGRGMLKRYYGFGFGYGKEKFYLQKAYAKPQ
ncbi:GumC family protein [Paracnuella aquatica]|uniref:GumC family protein n=1 Tax=Paracnuella aquatica TaxID=2268757 RepID=UPI000DEF5FDF|nr:polysaccharide biosynthesis tyrosine autokinase [Paracnuella aquatica]RPD47276.1 capsular biosynthesis protein [Paracnuella aquatica]